MSDAPEDKIDWSKAQFRFSVKSPEGKEVKVAVVPWPHPAAMGNDDWHAPKSEAKPDNAQLKNPQWADAHPEKGAQFEHGDTAQMQVEAAGHDGKRVKFIVEQRIDGKWKEFKTVTSVVRNGVAQAKVQAQHPAVGKKDAALDPHVLRFRNVFA
jgi:hypothetical protein